MAVVSGHDGHSVGEAEGGDPEVVGADEPAVGAQMTIDLAVMPARVRDVRENVKGGQQLLSAGSVADREPGRQFAGHDENQVQRVVPMA